MAELLAKIEWVVAQEMQKPKSERKDMKAKKPCYFNTGCCCFRDGDVTGLEIANREIRLVRWPDDEQIAAHGRVVVVPHGGVARLFGIPASKIGEEAQS